MGRIPESEVERLKREISVERLAEARGISLRRSGKELIGLCPVHNDTHPSLNIDPVKNVWHCQNLFWLEQPSTTTKARSQKEIRPSSWPGFCSDS